MTDVLSGEISELLPWLKAFESVALSHRGRFDLDDRTLAEIAGAREQLEEAHARLAQSGGASWDAGRAIALAQSELAAIRHRHAEALEDLVAAGEARDRAFRDAASALRPIVERLQVHDALSSAAPAASGLPGARPRAVGSSVGREGAAALLEAPVAPTDLAVTFDADRVHVVRWKTGNGPGTSYLVEAAVGTLYRGSGVAPDTTAYKPVGTVTDESACRHTAKQIPRGVLVKYRVRAARGGVLSGYSAEVTVACR